MATNAPVKNIRVGNISCAVWESEFDGNVVQSFTFSKSYKDKSGAWKNSNSFKGSELMLLITAAQEAIKFKYLKGDTNEATTEKDEAF